VIAIRSLLVFLLLAVCSVPALANADELKATRTPVGTPVEVTAGQEFYAETQLEEVPAYKLERPFKSSMAGAMGFPFGFAIESELLIRTKTTNSGWEYFVPADGKFRAYHGILGSVIREGDTVGLRVHSSGRMEWFVDNSNYNGYTTIWSRKLKKKDPQVTRITTTLTEPTGDAVERLIYLGLDANGNARIRHERILKTDIVRDEFTFPLDENGQGAGAVRGAQFLISANPITATITVTKPMSSGIGAPILSNGDTAVTTENDPGMRRRRLA